jgi:hypothetical protein
MSLKLGLFSDNQRIKAWSIRSHSMLAAEMDRLKRATFSAGLGTPPGETMPKKIADNESGSGQRVARELDALIALRGWPLGATSALMSSACERRPDQQ